MHSGLRVPTTSTTLTCCIMRGMRSSDPAALKEAAVRSLLSRSNPQHPRVQDAPQTQCIPAGASQCPPALGSPARPSERPKTTPPRIYEISKFQLLLPSSPWSSLASSSIARYREQSCFIQQHCRLRSEGIRILHTSWRLIRPSRFEAHALPKKVLLKAKTPTSIKL